MGVTKGTAASITNISGELSGAAGIVTFPTKAVAANGVSLAEVLRYISEAQTPVIVNKAAADVQTGADVTLFTVASGNIELLSIVGEVTVVIASSACVTRLKFNPTGTGADVDLCDALDINADAVGTFYSITGVLSDPLQDGLWYVHKMASPIILGPGIIEIETSANVTGSIEWHLSYRVIDTGATVT